MTLEVVLHIASGLVIGWIVFSSATSERDTHGDD